MRYFAHIAVSYTANNRLQESVLEAVQNMDRKVLESKSEALLYKANFISMVEEKGAEFKRCKPLLVDDRDYRYAAGEDSGDFVLRIPGLIQINIYKEKL